MAARKPAFKHGFYYYLTLSFLLHIVLMVMFSFINFPETKVGTEVEMLPVRIQFRQPLKPARRARIPGWLDPGKLTDFQPARERYAALSRLPDFLRRAPRPPGVRIQNLTARLSVSEVETEPFEVNMVPDSPVKIDTVIEDQETKMFQKKQEVAISDQLESRDDFMPLGAGGRTEEERQLLNRPVFPYARLSYLLPPRDIQVEFSFDVSPAGEVTSVNILSSSGGEELDRELIRWLKKWEYEPASGKSSLTTSIEIPAE